MEIWLIYQKEDSVVGIDDLRSKLPPCVSVLLLGKQK
jgi:hypothetical protein